jgi:hypothetical protein
MLAKGGTDGGMERLACRFLTREDDKTAFGVWREMMHYKYGMPTQPVDVNTTVNYTEALVKAKERMRAARERSNLIDAANPKESSTLPVN